MAEAAPQVVDEGEVSFTSDSQLLSELGERLIATPDVALSELIKNAYDADATKCHIWLEDDASEIVVKDDGHGMTKQEFLDFWMTIATPNRNREPTSRRYDREVTGSKGVGRFAVRNLGEKLDLRTVAYYEDRDEYLELTAGFDWENFEPGQGLQEMTIEYELQRGVSEEDEGTTLRISKLRDTWSQDRLEEVSGEVLDIASAPYEMDRSEVVDGDEEDPGFSVFFAPPGEESPQRSAAREIYERNIARVVVDVEGDTLTYEYEYKDTEETTYTFELENNLVGDLQGEIRFIPHRKGVFRDMDTIDGRSAPAWLRQNGGVRVIDKNFRVPPYGDEHNDWLNLSESHARRERQWRSPITPEIAPLEDLADFEIRQAQLRLPRKNQILGAIHISSSRPEDPDSPEDASQLVAAMDRQGFIENEAMEQLRDITRGSLEILAVIDFVEQQKKKQEEAEEKKEDVSEKIESKKKEVKERVDVSPSATEDIVESLDEIGEEVDDYQEAQEEAQTAVESMHLLGVITGFMSHETDVMLESAQKMLRRWRQVPEEERDEEFEERLQATEQAVEDLQDHLGYAKRFMGSLEGGSESRFPVRPRVEEVVEQFESYTEPRHIEIENAVPEGLRSPEINISLYSGVLMNLYSNAIKAVLPISKSSGERKIRFEAANTDDWHIVRVLDTGVGIPEGMEKRIFAPLFSTTEVEEEGPLGRGTGLGLYVVRRVLDSVGGEISVVDPPEGFETCFEVKIER